MAYTYAGQYGPETITNASGFPMKNLLMTIYLEDAVTGATLYTDDTKTVLKSNPISTDALGNLTFYADPGGYVIVGNGAALPVIVQPDPAEPFFSQPSAVAAPGNTPTINTNVNNVFDFTAMAAPITSITDSGTPALGDEIVIHFTDNGSSHSITFGTQFEASGTVTLPTTTVVGQRLSCKFLWNPATSKWRIFSKS